tara:strand:+ start:962 stop:2101 length:1140 start_codon:yes stop_codon:yes gene_type:complete
MKYCKKCILPDSRPGIFLDNEGICSGCKGHILKDKINWNKRYKELLKIIKDAKKKSTNYHCIVPISGGKDSWYQVILAKKLGLKILGITWKTPARTPLGEKNLINLLQKLKIDHIDYSISQDVEKKFMIAAFEKSGDSGLPMHLAIFSIARRLGSQLKIPLIIWGENSQLEYGGTKEDQLRTDLDSHWVKKHGCMQEKSAKDWIGINKLNSRDLIPYQSPKIKDFQSRSIFLGSFIKWNSFKIKDFVKKYGFKFHLNKGKVGAWNFADVDCDFISLHHLPKWHKFGITRDFDNLSVQIRYGLISRKAALKKLKKEGLKTPHNDIKKFCSFVGKSQKWFWKTCEKYRNKKIWYKEKGKWKIKDFIIKDWNWNENKKNSSA